MHRSRKRSIACFFSELAKTSSKNINLIDIASLMHDFQNSAHGDSHRLKAEQWTAKIPPLRDN
jgi:hypothetical protein